MIYNGYSFPEDLLIESDKDLEQLQYLVNNKKLQPIPLGNAELLKFLKQFLHTTVTKA